MITKVKLKHTVWQLAILLYVLPTFYSSPVMAQDFVDDEEQLIGLYGDEDMVSIATGIEQPISKAPAVASVISSEAIEAMGAKDLDEVLEAIPGLHVSHSAIAYNPIYVFRGIHSAYNPQVLVLINGIPITNLFHSDRSQSWGGMSVGAIERIEVIRGPGSALYGADAFAGTINVITKSGRDLNGLEVVVGGGSFSSSNAGVYYGSDIGGLDLGLALEFFHTEGQASVIESDAQTALDGLVGTSASLAPGPVNLSRSGLDLRFDVRNDKWIYRAGVQRRWNLGNGAGVAEALDPTSRYKSQRLNTDLTWEDRYLSEHWGLKAQVSYLGASQEIEKELVIFPPGVNLGWGVYEDGLLGSPEVFEEHYRGHLVASYNRWKTHRLRVGAGYYFGNLYDVREAKNFGIDPASGQPLPIDSGLVDVSDTPYVFLRESKRENAFVFVQDIWSLGADWELTAGIRYDSYSDFGETVNPRAALVWSTTRKLTTKLLYGEAFRAPSFAETQAINNPVVLGNPMLDPERLRSQEVDFDYQWTEDFNVSFNAFQYVWSDIIRFVPDTGMPSSTAQNTGERKGSGFELELDWQHTETVKIGLDVSWLDTNDDVSGGGRVAFAPHQKITAHILWEPRATWSVYAQVNSIRDRERERGDSRAQIADDTLVDVSSRYQINDALSVICSVKNLFDADAREPSGWSNPTNLPNDLPLAGRSLSLDLRYAF